MTTRKPVTGGRTDQLSILAHRGKGWARKFRPAVICSQFFYSCFYFLFRLRVRRARAPLLLQRRRQETSRDVEKRSGWSTVYTARPAAAAAAAAETECESECRRTRRCAGRHVTNRLETHDIQRRGDVQCSPAPRLDAVRAPPSATRHCDFVSALLATYAVGPVLTRRPSSPGTSDFPTRIDSRSLC